MFFLKKNFIIKLDFWHAAGSGLRANFLFVIF